MYASYVSPFPIEGGHVRLVRVPIFGERQIGGRQMGDMTYFS